MSPISRIAADGTEKASELTQVEKLAQGDHRSPQFLPDGRHFLYYARGTPEGRGVYVGQLDGAHSQRLLVADAAAVYASTGHILFVRQGTLYAERFDLDRLEVVGDPFPVAQQVIVNAGISIAALSASQAGPILYCSGSIRTLLVWKDRSGKAGESIGDANGVYLSPSLSPDGRRVAVAQNFNSNWDLYVIDIARSLNSRLTSDPAVDGVAVWSPYGSNIVFSSARKGPDTLNLYTMPPSPTGRQDLLLETPGGGVATDWSSDPQFLLYNFSGQKTGYDLWALPMDGSGKERLGKELPVARSTFNELNGQFSPDGKWVAYQSDESGRFEIYVQPFPGVRRQKSIALELACPK